MNKQTRGVWVWLIMVLLMFMGFSYISDQMQNSNNYFYQALEQDLANKQIAQAVIHQNEQVPSGQLVVQLVDGTRKDMYVDDVKEVGNLLKEADVSFKFTNVPQESKLVSTVLPFATADPVCPVLSGAQISAGRTAGLFSTERNNL